MHLAWGTPPRHDTSAVLRVSLVHAGAYEGATLVGFVNVATDGGLHAFVLDTAVAPSHWRRGIASALVRAVTEAARARGAEWLHVDCEPHLESFYRALGFRPTTAGLIDLRDS